MMMQSIIRNFGCYGGDFRIKEVINPRVPIGWSWKNTKQRL